MKNRVSGAVAAFFIVFLGGFASLSHAQFEAGKHYEVLDNFNTLYKKGVTEYFSYSCPHCFTTEPRIKAYMANRSNDVRFRKVPISFGRRDWQFAADAHNIIVLAKAPKELHDKVFQRIQVDRKPFKSRDDVYDFFADQGIDRDKAKKLLESFSGKSMAKRQEKEAINARITSVPTIVVNGRYRVILGSVATDKQFTDLLDYLSKLPV